MSQRSTERTVNVAVGLLLVVQLVTCFVAIAMLSRLRAPLGTAVVNSTRQSVLVEQQLARLARIARDPEPTLAMAYLADADELRTNTAEGQSEARWSVAQDAPLALTGDAAAVERSVQALLKIAEGSRQKLRIAEQALAFQSRAAAWVLVFLGGTLILFAGMMRDWLHRSLVIPLTELARVIEARAHGDSRARATTLKKGESLETTVTAINQLLDNLDELEAKAQENVASRALGVLLDRRGDAAVILAGSGTIAAMSASALALLASEAGSGYRARLEGLKQDPNPDLGLTVEVLDNDYRLVCLRPDALPEAVAE